MPPVAVTKNFFELFELTPTYDIDVDDLARRYRGLARAVHPDRYAAGSDQERRLALQTTALVNEAFQTLKHPVARARYLLRLRGVELDDATDTAMDAAFLMQQIELRERLEAARRDAQPRTRLAELARDVQRQLHETSAALGGQLAPGGAPARARELVREMQFLDKLQQQIADIEAELP